MENTMGQNAGLQANNKLKSYIKLFRPKQWIKNLFVFAALVFSNNILHADLLERTLLCFVLFCAASSSVYILNDMIDASKDRLHPKKKLRPIASGAISKTEALVLLFILVPAVLIGSFIFSKLLFLLIVVYFTNNILYCFVLKHMVIIDVMSIALGFILRVISGCIAIDVFISPWLLLCTLLLSLFLGFSKRRNELLVLEEKAEHHRKILDEYSLEFIDKMLSIIISSTVMAYTLYTFSSRSNYYLMSTIPFVLYGIFRYQYIIYKKNEGGSPEEVILSDKPLLIDMILWVLSSAAIIYFTA